MKAKGIIRIILDITMLALFVVLLFAYQTGLVFHEVMGLSILLFFILHIVLNWKWVSKVTKDLFKKTKRLFSRKSKDPHGKMEPAQINEQTSDTKPSESHHHHKGIPARTKTPLMYVLDYVVLFGAIQITVTGIMISQVLWPAGLFNELLFQIHRWTAYITVGFMGIHLLLHWKYLIAMFKAIFKKLKDPVVSRTLNESFAVLMVVALVCTGFIANIQNAYDNRFFAQFEDDDLFGIGAEDPDGLGRTALERYMEVFVPLLEEKKRENNEAIDALKVSGKETSLDRFLGGMFCTICIRFCPLNALACGNGRNLNTDAEKLYQQIVETSI